MGSTKSKKQESTAKITKSVNVKSKNQKSTATQVIVKGKSKKQKSTSTQVTKRVDGKKKTVSTKSDSSSPKILRQPKSSSDDTTFKLGTSGAEIRQAFARLLEKNLKL